MNPNDPWSMPAPPLEGERTKEALYESVGRALSNWEQVEVLLSHLFSYFIGLHEDALAARRAYGSVAAFSARAEMVRAAAEVYFHQHPDVEKEAQFKEILKIIKRAAPRRNDIAHGQVLVYSRRGTPIGYCLVPSGYNSNRNDIMDVPAYAYTAATVDRFGEQFDQLSIKPTELFVWISGKHQAQRAGRHPPSIPKATR